MDRKTEKRYTFIKYGKIDRWMDKRKDRQMDGQKERYTGQREFKIN